MMKQYHPFHMVTQSPWPIMNALISWNLMSQILWSNTNKMDKSIILAITMTVMSTILWWMEIKKETTMKSMHYNKISNGMKMSMILFIISEIMFFFSFFWAYFHSSISPNMEMGMKWPPNSINSFNPMNVPLLNTIILVSSGVSVTWTHNEMMKKEMKKSNIPMTITCILGMYFIIMQTMEYTQAEFSMSDSSYGSTFFMATGFHGLHVMIGTTFLYLTLNYMMNTKSNPFRMLGFEMASWYWHFVDMVWLFLFLSIYWWSF